MFIEMLLANGEDLVRLRKLEDEGKMPPGFADKATQWTFAYLVRIAELSIKSHARQ